MKIPVDLEKIIEISDTIYTFNETYGFYPEYPVADAGYGSYNNYLFCHQKV